MTTPRSRAGYHAGLRIPTRTWPHHRFSIRRACYALSPHAILVALHRQEAPIVYHAADHDLGAVLAYNSGATEALLIDDTIVLRIRFHREAE